MIDHIVDSPSAKSLKTF